MTAYLGLGSNIGDRRENIERAVEMLRAHPHVEVVRVSSLYETAPVGYTDQPDFLNAAAEIETALSPRELLDLVHRVEDDMGRVRTFQWGPRVIDIDILLYDDLKMDEAGLRIPHPEMMERRFVLEPLAEIAPGLILPDGRTAREAAQATLNSEL